jgi:hypothetical protein
MAGQGRRMESRAGRVTRVSRPCEIPQRRVPHRSRLEGSSDSRDSLGRKRLFFKDSLDDTSMYINDIKIRGHNTCD